MGKHKSRATIFGQPDALQASEGPAKPGAKDTSFARDTVTPNESDPLWEQLGSTRITDGPAETPANGSAFHPPADDDDLGPSQVLGKNKTTVGEFRLIKKLGEGAMGEVWKAEQPSYDNRTVALKILFPHVAGNPKLVKRLKREADAMFALDHPNIVQAYAYDEADGFHYVAIEYIDGRSMQKWLTQLGRLPVADSVRIALECAKALAYAHQQNMVHRDVKPDNILLTKKGKVKVADLGMVKIDDEEMSLTQTGHAVGTPWFMPLEQARNAKEIDGRSDIYALGCSLYAFLTGKPPFHGRTIVDVIQAKELGTFPPARQANSEVPERLDLIIAKMTAKLPKYRYQNCEEVIKDLESLNLASKTLTFLQEKPVAKAAALEENVDTLGKTAVTGPAKSRSGADFAATVAAPLLDPNLWYVQSKTPSGAFVTRQYNTSQLQKMLTDGTMKPNALASHRPGEGFRTLGTYKEFQGAALGNMAKKAADKNNSRSRDIYKQIEEEELARQQAEKERLAKEPDSTMEATRRYWIAIAWKVVPAAAAFFIFIMILWYLAWLAVG
jgi:eukaryotic-like serine/threonine-protein kinase